jgi:peptidoglycan/LPS O-acetylase OafA/YrhL
VKIGQVLRLHPQSDELMTIDFLRVVASLGIVIYHYHEYLSPNFLPALHNADLTWFTLWVDLFFTLSGFVISWVYFDRLGSGFSYGRFLQKRVARLIPLHWATLLFYAAIGATMFFGVKPLDAGRFDWGCFIPNALLLHSAAVCRAVSFNTVSWSISAEMAMYLLFPVMALLVARMRGLPALVLAGALIVLLTLVSSEAGRQPWLSWASQWGCIRAIPSFLIGMSMFRNRDLLQRMPVPKLIAVAAFALFMVLGALGVERVALLLLIYLIVACAVAVDLTGAAGPALRRLGAGGQLTYSIYMLHLPVATVMMTLARRALHLHGAMLDLWILITFAVMIVASILSYKFFELPARNAINAIRPGGARAAAGS